MRAMKPCSSPAMRRLCPAGFSQIVAALLALPQAQALPDALREPVYKYLKAGGHLLALGAPAWANPLEKSTDGRWLPAGSAFALAPPPHRVVDLTAMKPADWVRGSNHPEISERVLVRNRGGTRPTSATALRFVIPRLDGYDTWLAPKLPTAPFPAGNVMTVFSARGGPHTRGLVVEWREKDDSRWIATVPLSEDWRRFSLPPDAFKSWDNSESRSRAGFHPENAEQLSLGLAFSHTGQTGGPHEVWIAEVGTARADEAPAMASR